MAKYSAGGKASRILAAIENGPVTSVELVIAATGATDRKNHSKAWRVITALKADRLIQCEASFYYITQAGRDALTCLRAGQAAVFEDAPVPTVRLFTADRRAA